MYTGNKRRGGDEGAPHNPEWGEKILDVLSIMDMEFDIPTSASILLSEGVLEKLEPYIRKKASETGFNIDEWSATVRRGGEQIGVKLKRIFKDLKPPDGENILRKEVIIFRIKDEDSWDDVRLGTFIEYLQDLTESFRVFSDKSKSVVVAFIVFGDELFNKITHHWIFMKRAVHFDAIIYPEDVNIKFKKGKS